MLFLMQSKHCFLHVHHTTAMSHKVVTLSLTVITVIPHLCHTTAMPVTQQCALSVGVTQCCCSTQNYCHTHVFSIIVSHHDYFGTWLMEVCLFVFLNQIHTTYLQRTAHALGSDTSCLTFSHEGNILASRGGKNKTINSWELRNIHCTCTLRINMVSSGISHVQCKQSNISCQLYSGTGYSKLDELIGFIGSLNISIL